MFSEQDSEIRLKYDLWWDIVKFGANSFYFLKAKLDGGPSICSDNLIVEKDWVWHENNICQKQD